ncbi:hypothetical protein BD413DRAFT_578843 [Trametes elegans]|nr:hypothetical protein BD413DRAFT_578843 [Trametes elegans]
MRVPAFISPFPPAMALVPQDPEHMATSIAGRRWSPAKPISFILSLGPAKDTVCNADAELLTLGSLPLDAIPNLSGFCRLVSSVRLLHRHIMICYVENTTTPILSASHVECQLEDGERHFLLSPLFAVRDFTSFDINIPSLTGLVLKQIQAPHLTMLRVSGDLSPVFRLLATLETRALSRLSIQFRRRHGNPVCLFSP